jgi:hypothetical protein
MNLEGKRVLNDDMTGVAGVESCLKAAYFQDV